MAGKFIITRTKNGDYTFSLKAGNGEIILNASETYTTLAACESGIASVKRSAQAAVEDQTRKESVGHPKYELYMDKAGEYRFRLTAADGASIGKSEGYKAKASAKKGIASIGRNAPDAPVVAVDPET